ncbi:hypothetical protein MKW92_053605 [Papaver armeniacum]|nr:hypothetical protein MKW92_053605 [Papaver armeniacum]
MAIGVLKNQDLLFANRPFTAAGNALLYGCTDIAFSSYNEYLRKIRRMCILGKKYGKGGDNKRYSELPEEVTKLLGAVCFGDLFPSLKFLDVLTGFTGKLKTLSKEVDAFLDQVIDEHLTKQEGDNVQENKKEYFVDILLASQTEQLNLTRNNVKAILLVKYLPLLLS